MASYDLVINCYHQVYTIFVHPQVCVNNIIQDICRHFDLINDAFFLEIYDEQLEDYVDFDDRYQDDLRERLPKLQRKTLIARITFFDDNPDIENPKSIDETLLPIDAFIRSPVGVSMMNEEIQMDSDSNMDTELIIFSKSIEASRVNSPEQLNSTDRIIFTRDVIPYEKDICSSSTVDKNKTIGIRRDRQITRLQGIKVPNEKRFGYALPEIKIPSHFVNQNRYQLVVAIVLEELNDDQITCRLHKSKGFLPEGTGTDATPLNPIHLDINELIPTENETFKLSLRIRSSLKTQAAKLTNDSIFYSLPVDRVRVLHDAEHTPNVPRLACVIADKNNTIQWKTLALSNFIRPIIIEDSKSSSQKLENQEIASDKEIMFEKTTNSIATTQRLLDRLTIRSSFEDGKRRIIQNYATVWLDSFIDAASNDFLNSFVQLQHSTNILKIFTDSDECMNFLTDLTDIQVFMIVSGSLGQHIIPLIHNTPQIHSIYIFCENPSSYQQLAWHWPKVTRVFTEIKDICELLERTARQYDRNNIAISFVSKTENLSRNLNELDSSFMYTQLMKEILFELDYNEKSVEELCEYFYEQYPDNPDVLNKITKIEKQYYEYSPIWWYTSSHLLYSVLNRALRTFDVDTIIKMGFYIRDLHKEIENIYSIESIHSMPQRFTVYRGQQLSVTDLNKMKESIGGLLSFNSFLSTSRNRAVACFYAESIQTDFNTIGVLFELSIDPTLKNTPYASINNQSYIASEEEILFSMHTIFRIERITQISSTGQLWEIKLTLTSDNDPELHAVTEQIRKETSSGQKGWYRLGVLLIKLGEFDKAEHLYEMLLTKTSDSVGQLFIYSQLGVINDAKGNYQTAISFHKKALETAQSSDSLDDLWYAKEYNNITQVYLSMADYRSALLFAQKALVIQEKSLFTNHLDFSTLYIRMGLIYFNIGDYPNALTFYEKALEIQQLSLPSHHPILAESYTKIGQLYEQMGEYTKALSFFEKSLEIYRKTLPLGHPDIAVSYNSIASIHLKMGEYSEALQLYEEASNIRQKTLPSHHPHIAQCLNNIGLVYSMMADYSKALFAFEKALEIQQNSLPQDHPDIATSYNNIGKVYFNMGDYSKALFAFEKALEIQQKSLPQDHPDIATSYNNIGKVYFNMGDYSKALFAFERALQIQQKSFPQNHPDIAMSYNNIGILYSEMEEYSKALSNYEKAVEIQQKSLPQDHPDLGSAYNNIGAVYFSMKNYSKALSFYQRASDIATRSLPPNHPTLENYKKNLERIKNKL